MEVYLDNSATTRCFDSVAKLMSAIMCRDYGNPASLHNKGLEAEQYLRHARGVIAKTLKASEKEILFTSGGTEADNLALIGAAFANQRAGKHLITTRIEHPAVLQPMEYLETLGFSVTYLPVDELGRVRLEELRQALRPDTILVSLMHTNNEIGSVQPLEEAGRIVKGFNPGIVFHADAVQGYGKYRIFPARMGIDLLSASGHKIHGPKGVGFLYVRETVKISPMLFGGGQQKGLRPGTENVPSAAGLAKAAEEVYTNLEADVLRMRQLKACFVERLTAVPGIRFNGIRPENAAGEDSAPHIVSLSAKGVRSEVLLHALEERGIYVSAGSACASRKASHSATLQAIGLEKELLASTLRFSFSLFTTREEIDYTIQALYDIIPMLRRYTRH